MKKEIKFNPFFNMGEEREFILENGLSGYERYEKRIFKLWCKDFELSYDFNEIYIDYRDDFNFKFFLFRIKIIQFIRKLRRMK
jgi:hypothetical protein